MSGHRAVCGRRLPQSTPRGLTRSAAVRGRMAPALRGGERTVTDGSGSTRCQKPRTSGAAHDKRASTARERTGTPRVIHSCTRLSPEVSPILNLPSSPFSQELAPQLTGESRVGRHLLRWRRQLARFGYSVVCASLHGQRPSRGLKLDHVSAQILSTTTQPVHASGWMT